MPLAGRRVGVGIQRVPVIGMLACVHGRQRIFNAKVSYYAGFYEQRLSLRHRKPPGTFHESHNRSAFCLASAPARCSGASAANASPIAAANPPPASGA
eukprot:COSAG01_NODE_266_length_19876_cov_13.504525_7_plen_97_part_01